MAAQWIHDKARRTGVPRELEHQIVHIVLAHHGRMEFGSPRPPMTLEAMIVHYIDDLDSRVNSWLNLMGREGGNRRWTNADNVYEQPIWRGALPTTQVEKKGPAPEVLTPVIYVPREGSRQSAPGAVPQGAAPEGRSPRARRRSTEARGASAKAADAGRPGGEGGGEARGRPRRAPIALPAPTVPRIAAASAAVPAAATADPAAQAASATRSAATWGRASPVTRGPRLGRPRRS